MALVDPAGSGLLVAGVLMLALAAALLWLDFSNRVNRAFALFLTVRAVVNGVQAFFNGDIGDVAYRSWMYFALAVTPATLWFLHVYRVRYAGARARPWIGPVLVGSVAVLFGAYASDHALFIQPPTEASTINPGILGFLGSVLIPTYGLAAWVFARDYAHATDPARRRSMYLLSLGMAFDAAFFGLLFPLSLVQDARPTFVLNAVVAGLALVPIAFAVREIARADGTRRDRTLYVGGLVVVAATVVVAGAGFLASPALGNTLVRTADAFWTALMPLLAAYALVRHQMFDVDVKVKWTVSRGTVAAVFVIVFVVATQVAQELLNDRLGLLAGGAATAMLLFAIAPVQRFAERVASAAVPGVRPVAELDHDARIGLYREQLAAAWSDGSLSADEVRLLRVARDRLGLSLEDVDRLEREAATR